MQEIKVYDNNNEQITMLVQWDLDVMLYIKESAITKAYTVHFFNTGDEEALAVSSTYSSGTLSAKIPNILLQTGLPIIGYIFIEESDGAQRSIYTFTILVRECPRSSEYLYTGSDDYITITTILEECKEYAEQAQDYYLLSKSWAVGDTGVRSGENTDNSKYYAQQAANSASDANSYANNASSSANSASSSATNAANSASEAGSYANNASSSANSASSSATSAANSAEEAKKYAEEAGSGSGSGGLNGDDYALRKYYGDDYVSVGRASGTTVGLYSFAFGSNCRASGSDSYAEGYYNTASGDYGSHAEGRATTASGNGAHAEGYDTIASNSYAHAEGSGTTASGIYCHAEGYNTTAGGGYSHAQGLSTTALANNCAMGHYNNDNEAAHTSGTSGNYALTLGNGTNTSVSNAFRVTYGGAVYALSAFNSSGADYAEFIKEWADGNPNEEDRVGYFVTIKDGFLYKADADDYIVGVTSGNPSIVGNSDEDYYWKYERDDLGRIIFTDVEEEALVWTSNKESNNDDTTTIDVDDSENTYTLVKTGKIIENGIMVLSDDYDSSLQSTYVERKDRPEWDYVGMIGVIPVRDDGTCKVDAWCKCGGNGIATYAEERGWDTYRVIERVSENVISVILK